MRNHVSVLGRLKCDLGLPPGMEVFIDHLGEFSPEAANLDEIIDAGTQYPLEAAELLQQLAPLHRPEPRNGFENRLAMTLGALFAVSCDCKTMRFVAHALNQVQCTGVRRQYSRGVLAQQDQLFLPCPPIYAFGDPDQRDSVDAELLENFGCFGQLALAAVDEQYIRLRDLAVAHALVASRQRLIHRRVIIAGLDAADVEAPVIALQRPFDPEYDAGCHGVVPPVWLMSKHSRRLGASSRSNASRKSSRLDSMPARARRRMFNACSALVCIISSQRARMPRTELQIRTLCVKRCVKVASSSCISSKSCSTMISAGASRSK